MSKTFKPILLRNDVTMTFLELIQFRLKSYCTAKIFISLQLKENLFTGKEVDHKFLQTFTSWFDLVWRCQPKGKKLKVKPNKVVILLFNAHQEIISRNLSHDLTYYFENINLSWVRNGKLSKALQYIGHRFPLRLD